ncbi:CABIT domain-containing protein [Nephila pilipes]|uniref:CABIT domain-containing protein n=2 Tax=Nephila pilipes TaxID=299642 RepID=A0A8X6N3E9_NEPPI|nr:CABIT domain-containing protein [Nephila pilipes]
MSSSLLILPPLVLSPMSMPEATPYLAAVQWGHEGRPLREFAAKTSLPLPVKIIKGQHQNLGVPSLPSPNLCQFVLVASAGKHLKVIAQCVKVKDGRRMAPLGPRLALPHDYEGWFEILSEEGRAVRCIESVAELARRKPRSCLVRDTIKVHLPRPDDLDSVWEKTRIMSPGEVLTVGEIVSGVSRGNRGSGKYLGCVTSFGDTVYLPLELRGRFSTIAGEDNISGVHTVKTLMTKRFPLMVRLVHGKPPVGVKPGSQFVHEMRLYSLIEEECLVAMPLSKDVGVVPLPPNAPLKVLSPKNSDSLMKMPEHAALVNKCHNLMTEVSGLIQVCDVHSVHEIKHTPPSPQYVYTRRQASNAYRTVPLVKRSASDPQGTNHSGRIHLERGLSTPNDPALSPNEEFSDSDDVRYDEIDQIYDYVRGFAPLPVNIKNEFSANEDHKSQLLPQISVDGSSKVDRKPPDPPPIETIPVRKSSTGTVRHSQTTPQKITVSIVNRTPSFKTKDIYYPHRSQKSKKSTEDHIYEKIDKRKNGLKLVKVFETPNRNTPLRSNSASKVFQNGNANCDSNNNTKAPYKRQGQFQLHLNPSQNVSNGKSRFLKNNKNNSHAHKEIPGINRSNNNKSQKSSWVNSGVKTIATSPLFHIRYKSLTDLLMDSKKTSPDSSNTSSGKKASGSAGSSLSVSSKDDGNGFDDQSDIGEETQRNGKISRRLSRPKSLSNLIGDATPKKRLDNHNYYNLVQNDLIKPPDINCPKFYSMPDSSRYAKNHYGNTHHSKKLGTLYL